MYYKNMLRSRSLQSSFCARTYVRRCISFFISSRQRARHILITDPSQIMCSIAYCMSNWKTFGVKTKQRRHKRRTRGAKEWRTLKRQQTMKRIHPFVMHFCRASRRSKNKRRYGEQCHIMFTRAFVFHCFFFCHWNFASFLLLFLFASSLPC